MNVRLANGTVIDGQGPIVIIGPNGSGKTRASRGLTTEVGSPEFVGAMRNTGLPVEVPAMQKTQADQQFFSSQEVTRNQHWAMQHDVEAMLAKALAEHSSAAIQYRDACRAGLPAPTTETVLDKVSSIWRSVFPNRELSFGDHSPRVTNRQAQDHVPYTVNMMSDGERAAVYLATRVLMAKANHLVVIDEPEIHFHPVLAAKFWNSLEDARDDCRFAYITHDLKFAKSRRNATVLRTDPATGYEKVSVAAIPEDLVTELLGAATLSSSASRFIFCEGDDVGSIDCRLYRALFEDERTVVHPVGSCERVRQCVAVFRDSSIVAGATTIGIVDSDYWPSSVLEALHGDVRALPYHEVEGFCCDPRVVACVARLLDIERVEEAQLAARLVASIDEGIVLQTALERWKVRVRSRFQSLVNAVSPKSGDVHTTTLKLVSSLPADSEISSSFETELEFVSTRLRSGIQETLRTFPCKQFKPIVASALGMKYETYQNTLLKRLRSVAAENQSLRQLGNELLGHLGT
jgi:hypothetical protein